MANISPHQMRLYSRRNERLYLNASELERFMQAARRAPADQRLFALTLAYTGIRLSEARALRTNDIQLQERVLAVRTLKQRDKHLIREVPIPPCLIVEFKAVVTEARELVWHEHGHKVPRITAYRWIKRLMASADITGPKASPKGLRHAYGARAVLSGVPLHMLQRWMGHASMKTTAIYATVLGAEQLALSDRMWR